MIRRHVLRGILAIIVTSVVAGCGSDRTVDESADEANMTRSESHCDEGCAVDIFKDFSKVFRPSNREDRARAWLKSEVEHARPAWRERAAEITVDEDAAKDPAGNDIVNVLVRVPGTLRYADRKPIVIQSHLDMVLAVKDAPSGARLEPFFEKGGVDVVEDSLGPDGESVVDAEGRPIVTLHARDYKTTLGADNGQGVAWMVRYLRDPSLPHPPLELVFTAAEEVGLVGAQMYDAKKLPLQGAAMVSLDGSSNKDPLKPDMASPPAILVGANGSVRHDVDAKLPAAPLDAGATVLEIKLSGLAGGHSGVMIFARRMNSIKTLAHLLGVVRELEPNARLVDATVGEVAARKGHNKIPNAFSARVALPEGVDVAKLKTTLDARLAKFSQPFADEVQASIRLSVVESMESAAGALSPSMTATLAEAIDAMPNGVIEADPAFPNGVKASSNLGLFGLPSAAATADLYMGYMPRAFALDTARANADKVFAKLTAVAKKGGLPVDGTAFTKLAVLDSLPWAIPTDAPIVKVTRAIKTADGSPLIKDAFMLAGGTEPGEFVKRFPQLKDRVIGFGPVIVDAHTPKERMGLASFKASTTALQQIIVAWAEDPELLR
jgi:dipeptidase D